MLTPNDLRELVLVGGRNPSLNPSARARVLEESLRAMGNPDGAEVVSAAVAGLDSEDRNVRAAMLRVLGLYAGADATAGVLRGLADPKRRVREVAIKASHPNHVGSKTVIEALRLLAEDESETDRIRRNAFFALSSSSARDALPDLTRQTMNALMESTRFRLPILVRLCKSIDHTDETRALLHDFVATGTKDEAVMATRALCGFCLAQLDAWPDPAQRQHLRDTCDRAPAIRGTTTGEGYPTHWVPREELAALWRSGSQTRLP